MIVIIIKVAIYITYIASITSTTSIVTLYVKTRSSPSIIMRLAMSVRIGVAISGIIMAMMISV